MERPRWAPPELYNEMKACWSSEPGERPTFTELAGRMSEFLSAGARDQYLELSSLEDQLQAQSHNCNTLPKDFRIGASGQTSAKLHSMEETDKKPLQRQMTFSNPGYKCSFNS